MKIAEYNQMMSYLTRPEPEVLPQPKPQELLDLQEQNRKQRLLQSLQKIGGGLEDSSLDFIRRENFSEGTPTGYITRKQLADKLNITPSAIEGAKTRNTPLYQKIKELMNISKEGTATNPEYYKPKKGYLNTAIKEIKKSSGIEAIKGPREEYRGKKTTLSQVKDVLNKSNKPLDVKQISDKLPDSKRATIRTSLNVLKDDKNFKNKIGFVSPSASASVGAQTKMIKNTSMINVLRDVFVNDPDADSFDIAKAMVGDKKFNAANEITKQKYLKDAAREVPKFVSIFSKGAKTKIPGFKDINPNILGDILESLEARISDFGFEPGTRRDLQLTIADASRNLPEFSTRAARTKLMQKGKAVDEVVGVSATFDRAPGYIEATQVIDKDVNMKKGKILDNQFSNTFKKTLEGDFSGVKEYNKKANDFSKKYKVDVPIIKTGNNLNPEKIISYFKNFSPGAQENIKQIAKEKGVVIQTKSKPLFMLVEKIGIKPTDTKSTILSKIKKAPIPNKAKALLLPIVIGATAITGADLMTGSVEAAEGRVEEAKNVLPSYSEAAGLTTAAAIGSKATKADPLKGLRRFGKEGAKNLLKGIFKVAGAPTIAAGFAGSELLDYEKPEDASVIDRLDPRNYKIQEDPNIKLAGASLLAPELVGSLAPAGKSILSRAGSILMNPFGKAARAFTPVGLATIAGGAGYDVYKEIKRRQELTDEERLQEDIEAQEKDDEMMVGAAEGGRIGFADGPDDPNNPGRRKFMKLAAGLASLPILGKFFKVAEKAAPLVQQIKNSSTAMPDWFPNFVDKFIGRSIGKKIDADFMEYTNPDLPNIKLSKSDDGKILIEGRNEFSESYNINYEPPGYEVLDYKTGKSVKTSGEFEAVEGRHVALGPEDYDTDPFYAEDLDDLFTSDVADMEKYATGNVSKTVKDAFGKETGLKKGKYDVDMAQGQAENRADILRDEGLDEID